MPDHSKTVLIADDNSLVRRALRGFFEDNTRIKVCGEAADGLEAVMKAEEHKPDLILMDLSMPKMSGAQAARAIKNSLPQTRIFVFTLYQDSVGKAMAKALGVDLVIAKSDGATALTKALRIFLADSLPKTKQLKTEKAANPVSQTGRT